MSGEREPQGVTELKRFDKQSIVVTGGGSGIGRAISVKLASEGGHISLLDVDLASAKETVTEITAAGGTATAYSCDVSDHAMVADVIATVCESAGLEVLINNAGIAHIGNVENTSEQELDRLYRVNVKGVYNTLSATIPFMKKKQRGVVLNVASIASSVGLADRFAYSMTKGAVLTMTYSVARDYINHGIRCNCIAPARVHTPFVDNFLARNYPENIDEMFQKLSRSQPLGRMGTVDEVASLVAFLCSNEASFITGANIPIDGGFVTLNT